MQDKECQIRHHYIRSHWGIAFAAAFELVVPSASVQAAVAVAYASAFAAARSYEAYQSSLAASDILWEYSGIVVAAGTAAVNDAAGVEVRPGPVAAFQASFAFVAALAVGVDTDWVAATHSLAFVAILICTCRS